MQVVEKLTINGSADKIWEILRSFDKVETYQSGTTKTELVGQGVGSQRTLTITTPDGNTINVVEKLDYLNDDDKTMKLSLIDGPFPLNSAVVTIKVNSLEDNKTEVEFDGNIDPKPGAEEGMENGFKFAFQDSLQGLEKLAS